MQPPPDKHLKEMADGMGISLFQRFTLNEASLFLRCQIEHLRKAMKQGKIEYLIVADNEPEFFGFQLVEYLLSTAQAKTESQPKPFSNEETINRIIRADEVEELTGLSRITLWRMERKGEFPARISLTARSVG